MDFIEYLQSMVVLAGSPLQGLNATMHRKTYAKKELVLPADNRSKQMYFIERGIARVFYLRGGRDVTLYFLAENKIGLPIDSIFYNEVCKFGIEALAETKVATIAYHEWETLMKREAALQQLSLKLMAEYIKKSNDRLYNIKFQTPRERYQAMLAEFPGIELHAPLSTIASYLGITQETLSRLRALRI